jgi:hypothetical protein
VCLIVLVRFFKMCGLAWGCEDCGDLEIRMLWELLVKVYGRAGIRRYIYICG